MRRVWWAGACVVAASLIAGAFYAAFWLAQYRRLPRLAEMNAACGVSRAATRHAGATATTTTRCKTYFAEVDRFRSTALKQTAITGLLAAFILLVLRFRVRPLAGPARPSAPI